MKICPSRMGVQRNRLKGEILCFRVIPTAGVRLIRGIKRGLHTCGEGPGSWGAIVREGEDLGWRIGPFQDAIPPPLRKNVISGPATVGVTIHKLSVIGIILGPPSVVRMIGCPRTKGRRS